MAKKKTIQSVATQSGDVAVQASPGVTESGSSTEGNTLSSEIARLTQAKADIKAAIEAKGVTVGNGTIDTYASKIGEISTGGSVIEEAGAEVDNIIVNLYILPYMGHSGGGEQFVETGGQAVVQSSISTQATEIGAYATSIDIGITGSPLVCIYAVEPQLRKSSYEENTKTRTIDLFFKVLEYSDEVTICIDWQNITKSTQFFTSDGHPYIYGHCDAEGKQAGIVVMSGITEPAAYTFSLMNFLE